MSRVADDTMPVGTMAGTPQVLLAHHLKQLKLPTVLASTIPVTCCGSSSLS